MGEKTGKRGRPKTTDGKVNLKELREDVFVKETYSDSEGKETVLFSAIVWATSLKRKVRVVIVDCQEPGKKTQTRKVFFSTDINMSAKDIMDTYKTRFQIEFLLRDAKQFTGLTHCQSRKKNSLEFAFNMSLSTINVARAFARENNMELSMANIKTLIHNNMMLRRIIRTSGFRPNRLLNTNDFKELLFYGVAKGA
jgi:IS4 transposase